MINSTAPVSATEGQLLDLQRHGPGPRRSRGDLVRRRRGHLRRRDGAATGVYTVTPAGPTPPASCVMSVQVCDGGSPNKCATQSTTVTVTPVNDAPVINSTAPVAATEGQLLTYNATMLDADGPGATWSVGAADTCGGAIGATTGVYTVTPAGPTPPATCVLSVQVCDGGSPNKCTTQSTTVTITPVNDAPVINSTAPVTATEGQLLTYNATVLDPDGPGATWSVGAADTCGGAIGAATGSTPSPPRVHAPPATCVMSVQAVDGGSPNKCATQSTTVTVTPVNDAPVITARPL